MTNSTNNEWEKAFGARRRAIDRALLAECEKQIAAQEHARAPQDGLLAPNIRQSPKPKEHTPTPATNPRTLDATARAAIARAFGRAPS
jgi:hypothetical protein